LKRWLLPALALIAAAPSLAQSPEFHPIRASKIILVGDSTTQVGSGWGGSFCAEHVSSFLACVNLARGGRSSGSYRAEGSWDLALAEMKTPGFVHTWVLIQFGHNDQPGKPGRSTDLKTEFPANMRRYVAETRAAGAVPVLVTPLTRRSFKAGKVDNDLAPWVEAVRKVATETSTPLVDLNALSLAAVEAIGEEQADRLAMAPKPAEGAPPAPPAASETVDSPYAQRKISFDRTHLGRAGADYFAAMMARALVKAVPELKGLLYDSQPNPMPLR
jgi:lysophospholipase L1-like esterase